MPSPRPCSPSRPASPVRPTPRTPQRARRSSCSAAPATRSARPPRTASDPQLNGILSGQRKAGTAAGYTYSNAYKALDKTWSEENFRVYIKDPRGVTPGTKMVYPGLKDETQINDLVAYLKQFGMDGKKQ